jgi:putative IMPACT (imprinted ancient) family translation regulator
VVTRYFGGVKLGKGGLVRAYSGGVQHALREAATVERVERVRVAMIIPYTAIDPVRRLLAREGGEVTGERFESEVTLELSVPDDRRDAIVAAIVDATAGAARVLP